MKNLHFYWNQGKMCKLIAVNCYQFYFLEKLPCKSTTPRSSKFGYNLHHTSLVYFSFSLAVDITADLVNNFKFLLTTV
jgi:hypothetical protein